MADVVDPSVLDTVITASTLGLAQAGAFAFDNRFNDDVSVARRSGSIAEAHLGQCLKRLTTVGPVEGAATAKLFAGEANSAIASLLAQLASGSLGSKIAMSTPNESGNVQLLAQLVGVMMAGMKK